jgi:hypothetical protein
MWSYFALWRGVMSNQNRFYCKRLEEFVNPSEHCNKDCDEFENCKEDREVEHQEGLPELTEEQLSDIFKSLHVDPNEGLRNQVKQAARNYASNRRLWKSRLQYSESKAILTRIHKDSGKLEMSLAKLFEFTRESFGIRWELTQLLAKDGYNLSSLTNELAALHRATSCLTSKNASIRQRRLPDMPFNLLIEELTKIFGDTTSKTLRLSIYETSPFLNFVRALLKVLGDREKNLSRESLCKRCQRALDPSYSKPLKRHAGLSALTGTPFAPDTMK